MKGASGPFTDLRSRSPGARHTSSSRHEVPHPLPRQGSGGPPEAQGAAGARVLGPGLRSAMPRLPGSLGSRSGFLTVGGALVSGLQVRPRAAPGTPALLRGGHGGPERLREHGPAHLCPLQPGEWACKPGRCPTRHRCHPRAPQAGPRQGASVLTGLEAGGPGSGRGQIRFLVRAPPGRRRPSSVCVLTRWGEISALWCLLRRGRCPVRTLSRAISKIPRNRGSGLHVGMWGDASSHSKVRPSPASLRTVTPLWKRGSQGVGKRRERTPGQSPFLGCTTTLSASQNRPGDPRVASLLGRVGGGGQMGPEEREGCGG